MSNKKKVKDKDRSRDQTDRQEKHEISTHTPVKSKAKDRRVDMPDLPEPWQAFKSTKRDEVFFFNPLTKETTWDRPVKSTSRIRRDRSPPRAAQKDKLDRQDSAETSTSRSRKRRPEEETERRKPVQQLPPDSHNDSDSSMEVDQGASPSPKRAKDFVFRLSNSRPEEPMDIDLAGTVNTLRAQNEFVPPDRIAPIESQPNWPVLQNVPKALVVFDTSALLGDFNVLKIAMSTGSVGCIIPYVVVQELDSLKKSNREKLSRLATGITDYIYNELKNGSILLHVETAQESAQILDQFDCRKNDDLILKCAMVFARHLEEAETNVYLATNDKNLSIKALANQIQAFSDPEMINWLKSDTSSNRQPEPNAREQNTQPIYEESMMASSAISQDSYSDELYTDGAEQEDGQINEAVESALLMAERALDAVLQEELRGESIGHRMNLAEAIDMINKFSNELFSRNIFDHSLFTEASQQKLNNLKRQRSVAGREELLNFLVTLLTPLKFSRKPYASVVQRACVKADEVIGESRVITALTWRDQSAATQQSAKYLKDTLEAMERKRQSDLHHSLSSEARKDQVKLGRDIDRLERSLDRLLMSHMVALDDVGVFVDTLTTLHRYYCCSNQVRSDEAALNKKTLHQLLQDKSSSLRSALCELHGSVRAFGGQLTAA